MIRLTDDRRNVGGIALGGIWIGNSDDEQADRLNDTGIGAVLNVAQDLVPTRGWDDGVEAMHVGLIDGPGNEPAAYSAAVLALHALLRRHNTLVCCHSGTRALAVSVMYLNVVSHRGWDEWMALLNERLEVSLPTPRGEHREAFGKMNWRLLASVIGV